MAVTGAAEEDRPLVAHQLAAATGENWWSIGQARTVLLAPVSRESSDAADVRSDGAADGTVARASGVGEPST